MLTGQKFSLSKELIFLCSGATKLFCVKFIILEIGFITEVKANLRILARIPTHTVAFLRLNLLICLLINSSLMGWDSNDDGSVRVSLISSILG